MDVIDALRDILPLEDREIESLDEEEMVKITTLFDHLVRVAIVSELCHHLSPNF